MSSTDDQTKRKQFVRAIDELLGLWDIWVDRDFSRLTPERPAKRHSRDRTSEQMRVVLALATHAHETVRAVRRFLPDDLTVVHMPLIRSAYESTVAAVWYNEIDDGVNALVNKELNHRRNMRDTLSKTQTLAEFAEGWLFSESEDLETTSSTKFIRMCDDLVLDDAYANYRMLSGYSHATGQAIGEYFVDDDDPNRVRLRKKPRQIPVITAWCALLVATLVRAGTVANYFEQNADDRKARRSELNEYARALGISSHFDVKHDSIWRVESGSRRKVPRSKHR